ncbi:MAG: IS3 family transposase [Bacteroidota bacterium]
MVKPSFKKKCIDYLRNKYRSGLKSICSIMRISRSSYYYTSRLDDSEVIEVLDQLVGSHPNRGFDNYYERMRREGYTWSRNKVLRIYREQGLVRRAKRRRKLPEGLRVPLTPANQLNEVWSMDFMSDCLSDGRTIRILNVIDDYNRECILSEASISYPSARVIRALEIALEEKGKPRFIRTDNGPEFVSKEYKEWCSEKGITPIYAEPGKPMQNGYIERHNRTFREDVLDAYLFHSIEQVNIITEKWMEDFNRYHPHSALNKKSPIEFADRRQPSFGLYKAQKRAEVH